MLRRLPISLPWVLALLVTGWIVADNRTRGAQEAAAEKVAKDLVCNMDVATATARSIGDTLAIGDRTMQECSRADGPLHPRGRVPALARGGDLVDLGAAEQLRGR